MPYTLDDLLELCIADESVIDFATLYGMAEDADVEVRQCVAELLSYDNKSDTAKTILIQLLQADDEEMVRAEAADSLSFFTEQELIPLLFHQLSVDQSELVCCNILLTLIDIAEGLDSHILNEVERILEQADSPQLNIIWAGYLYRHGQANKLSVLLEGLKGIDMYDRLCAAKQLDRVCTEDNYKEIVAALCHFDIGVEPMQAVRDVIEGMVEGTIKSNSQVEGLFTCPCCGFQTLSERYNPNEGTGYDICPYCKWEDDGTTNAEIYCSINKGSMMDYRKRINNKLNTWNMDDKGRTK